MFRIDHPTAAATLPPAEPAGTPGFFTKGNPSIGLLATRVKYDFLNNVQEEICGAIEGTGGTLDKEDQGQLLAAIQGAHLHGVDGYQVLPSGLILQWGTVLGSLVAGVGTVTLPIAFPTAFYGVSLGDITGSVGGVQAWGWTTSGLTNFNVYCSDLAGAAFSSSSAFWYAVGK